MVDHCRKKDDNRRDSCLIYRNYIRNPLKLGDKYLSLRNTAVILNGACSNTILKVISFCLYECMYLHMNLVKYATSTVNIIVIGSELEKNASLLDNEIVKEYYDTVNT